MGSIQTGQIVNKPIQQGSIQAGRISRGITSYDEQIRQGYLSKIDAQNKAYQDELDKINAQNIEITNKNAELKNAYDKVVNDIKGMTTQQYNTYYYTIPESVKGLFESPEQINIRAAEQKQVLAEEQKNTINSMIADYQTQYTYWMNEYNKRSGDSADYADRQRIQAEFHMQELQQALNYATGEYNTEEIIQVAQQRASDRVSQSEMSTDYSRMQEAEIQANVQKGLEPVYDNPLAINKTLLGYRDTTKVTDIPQSSIKVGLQQSQQQYTDSLGNPISYNPDLAKQNQINSKPFDFIFQQRYEPAKDKLNKPMSVIPKAPILTVTKAPSLFSTYKETTKKKGYVEGTLSFLGERLSSVYDFAIQKGYTSPERQESVRTGLTYVPQSIFFTQIGVPLVTAGGVEKIFKGESTTEKLMGGAQATLGVIGLRSQGKAIMEARALKQFEKAPILFKGGVVESSNGGFYTLYGKKQVGKNIFETYIEQPFKNLESGKSLMEGGKGISMTTISGKPEKIVFFETGGRNIPIETMPQIRSVKSGLSITTPLEGEASISRVYTKPVFEGKATILDNSIFVKGSKVNEPKVYESFLNIGKETEKGIGVISGKVKSLKQNIITGETKAIGKVDSLGLIKRITTEEEQGFSLISSSGVQKTKPFTALSTGQVTKGLAYVQPKLSTLTYEKAIGLSEFIAPRYVSGVEIKEPTKSSYSNFGNMFEESNSFDTSGITLEPPKTLNKEFELLYLPSKIKPNESFKTSINLITPSKSKEEVIFKQPSKFKEIELLKQPEALVQKQPQVLKEEQVFKQPQKSKQPQLYETKQILKTKTPKLPIFNIPKSSTQSKRINDILSKAFTVLIRSKGKVREIGWNLPKGKALKLGVEKSKSSLAQTFALRESGTTKLSDINYRVPENLFTAPRRTKTRITPITFVERRGKTLTHSPEVKGLQQSKKKIKSKWL